MPKSTSTSHTTVTHSISSAVCQTIIQTHRQAPEYLAEKYRVLQWENPKIQAQFIQGFTANLNQGSNLELLKARLLQALKKLFFSSFFQSVYFEQLERQVDELLQATIIDLAESISKADLPTSQTSKSSTSIDRSLGIAVLLLDVENLKLEIEAEKFLGTICACPIRIKIAFANWRTVGKRDIEFHQRGYQMIHVPSGANSADMKMTAIGSSIFLHYSNIQEILICSSDADLSHLCHTLTTRGLSVYSVGKRGEGLKITNTATGAITHYIPQPTVAIPALSEVAPCLKLLVKEEQQRTQQQWIKLSRISTLYHQKIGIRISDVISHHDSTKKVRDFLEDHASDFVIHQPADKEVYIAVFEMDAANKLVQESPSKQGNLTSKASLQTIRSEQELETVLIEIATRLTEKTSSCSISLSLLASEFNKQYGSASKVMKQLGLQGTLINLVSSLPSFKIQKEKQGYQVAIDPQIEKLRERPKGVLPRFF